MFMWCLFVVLLLNCCLEQGLFIDFPYLCITLSEMGLIIHRYSKDLLVIKSISFSLIPMQHLGICQSKMLCKCLATVC